MARKPAKPYDRGVYPDGTPTACVVISAQSDGLTHVHDADCGDLRKRMYADDRDDPVEVRDVRDVVEFMYGPGAGSFYEEVGLDADDPTAWKRFNDVECFPCVRLPYDIGRTTDTPEEQR